jgi:hypothetical protein
MGKQDQDGKALAATDNRTVAVRPSGNPLVARGLADLSNEVQQPDTLPQADSRTRGVMMSMIHNAAKRLLAKHGQGPTIEEIAKETGFTCNDIVQIQKQFFADPTFCNCRPELLKALKQSSYRQREVLKLLYGVGDGYHYSYEEVSQIFKEPCEIIQQAERGAALKVLEYFENTTWLNTGPPFRRDTPTSSA